NQIFRMILFKKYGKDKHYYRLIHRIFGVWASNIELYKLALVHRSASVFVDADTSINNERLEFLGDAVIETVISELLFIDYPDMQEGELTQLRSKIVCRASLNDLGRKIGLKGEIVASAGGAGFSKQNMYGDAVEALSGALYLDKGYDKASNALLKLFGQYMDVDQIMQTEIDFKSRMIEWTQKEHRQMQFWSEKSVNYSENSPSYETVLMIDGQKWGYGCSRSKKESEQKAAHQAYEKAMG
ncbi:MAG: ribonuclease III, partial [Mucinivorans sp.]